MPSNALAHIREHALPWTELSEEARQMAVYNVHPDPDDRPEPINFKLPAAAAPAASLDCFGSGWWMWWPEQLGQPPRSFLAYRAIRVEGDPAERRAAATAAALAECPVPSPQPATHNDSDEEPTMPGASVLPRQSTVRTAARLWRPSGPAAWPPALHRSTRHLQEEDEEQKAPESKPGPSRGPGHSRDGSAGSARSWQHDEEAEGGGGGGEGEEEEAERANWKEEWSPDDDDNWGDWKEGEEQQEAEVQEAEAEERPRFTKLRSPVRQKGSPPFTPPMPAPVPLAGCTMYYLRGKGVSGKANEGGGGKAQGGRGGGKAKGVGSKVKEGGGGKAKGVGGKAKEGAGGKAKWDGGGGKAMGVGGKSKDKGYLPKRDWGGEMTKRLRTG